MRALLAIALVLMACTTPPAASSPTPSPSPTPTPALTPIKLPPASPSPITLPSIAQLSAPSGTVVWALVAGTRLFRSSDRGDTWAERSLPTGLVNVEVAFANDNDGFLLNAAPPATQCQTQTVSIWRTGDVGTWQQLAASGIADAMCKRGLAVASSTQAFFSTLDPNHAPVTYVSVDGGRTWSASAPLPDPPGFTTRGAGAVLSPGRVRAFGTRGLVEVAAGGTPTRYVFRSDDGGLNWKFAATLPTTEGALAFVTAARWLLIGPAGGSRETTDAGATWHAYTTDYSQAAPIAPDVVFGDANVGYATVRGQIQRTVDGGAHWTAIKTPGTA